MKWPLTMLTRICSSQNIWKQLLSTILLPLYWLIMRIRNSGNYCESYICSLAMFYTQKYKNLYNQDYLLYTKQISEIPGLSPYCLSKQMSPILALGSNRCSGIKLECVSTAGMQWFTMAFPPPHNFTRLCCCCNCYKAYSIETLRGRLISVDICGFEWLM